MRALSIAQIPCRTLSASCFIDAEGTVYPCLTIDRPLASLRNHDFDLSALWTKEPVRSMAEQIRKGDCPGCWTPCEAFPAIAGSLGKLVL